MGFRYHPLRRSEYIIALGRTTLAAFCLLAIWIDGAAPARYVGATYGLLVAYLLYSLVLLALAAGSVRWSARIGAITHVADLGAFAVLLSLTDGTSSPLFVYFVFALLAAALRWQRQGVLWTAAAVLAIYVGLGVHAWLILHGPAFELDRFIIRSVYLVTTALLLGYLSAHEQRLRDELAKLAAWPRTVAWSGGPVEALLRHAAEVLDGGHALLVWDEVEEPDQRLALLANGAVRLIRDVDPNETLVTAALAEADFLCADVQAARPDVVCYDGETLWRWQGRPLGRPAIERFRIRSVLGLKIRSETVKGWLLILDKPAATADDLVLGAIVARQVATDLEQHHLQRRLQEAALAEERARFARDLHDGMLQSLAGIALQLKLVDRQLTADPAGAGERLKELQALIAAEQRDLRFFVRQLRPMPSRRLLTDSGMPALLHELAGRAERQWGLRVEVTAAPMTGSVSETLAHEIRRLVQEGLANAVRHGRASVARVRLGMRGDVAIELVVADNGCGFGFRGRQNRDELMRADLGPRSLMERVAALDGDLAVDSTSAGARIEMTLPLAHGPRAMPASSEAVSGLERRR